MMIRSNLKLVYYSIFSFIGMDKLRLRHLKKSKKIAVLNLHRIAPETNPYWSPMHPHLFENLLQFLRKNFDVCSFGDLQNRKDTDKPIAILSFDDGYRDFLEHAVPLLKKFGFKANLNIIPQCVETGEAMWNITLYDFLNSAPIELINRIPIPEFDATIKDNSVKSRLNFGLKIGRHLKMRPRREREQFLELITPFYEEIPFVKTKMLSTSEVKQISEIHEIGVHSFSHESMGYESNEYFETDFAKCSTYFENVLNLPLEIYAFPNGSYRAGQAEFLLKHDIKRVLLVDEQFADHSSSVVPRMTIYGESEIQIKMKSLGF